MNEYDEGRIWFKKKGKVITVGVTEKAFDEIGGIHDLSLPDVDDEYRQDDVIGEIEGEKQAFEIISPVDGVVEEINELLAEDFQVLETDPLDEGWLVKIRVQTPEDEESEEENGEEEE